MLERFSEEASRAVALADEEARRLGHDHIGTEHLLLGLVAETGSVASNVLIAKGATLAACREKVLDALASRTTRSRHGIAEELPYTERALRALDRAGRQSLRMGSDIVHTQHVLLSVLDVEGTAGQVLRGLFVDPEAVRRAIISGPSPSRRSNIRRIAAAAEGANAVHAPQCGSCGSPLEDTLDQQVLAVGPDASPSHVVVFYCTACGTALGAQQG
ncbi:MAG: hypothetical protein J2P57_03545 [Acidimicrobiaceae bacterium]|nr:hypothetical protein [Acidimicrobiaceae bacterium]